MKPFFSPPLFLAALAATCFFAAAPRPAAAQTSLFINTGTSKTSSSDLTIRQPGVGTDITFRNIDWATRPFSGSIYYGYRIEHFFKNRPNLGIDIDFTHNKVYSDPNQNVATSGTFYGQPVSGDTRLGDRVQEYRITNGVNTIGLDVLYRFRVRGQAPGYPFGQRLQPYVGGGPAYFIVWGGNTVNGKEGGRRYENSGFGFQLKGGARYYLTPDISLFGELKYTDGDAEISVADGGKSTTSLRTVHTLFGVGYTF